MVCASSLCLFSLSHQSRVSVPLCISLRLSLCISLCLCYPVSTSLCLYFITASKYSCASIWRSKLWRTISLSFRWVRKSMISCDDIIPWWWLLSRELKSSNGKSVRLVASLYDIYLFYLDDTTIWQLLEESEAGKRARLDPPASNWALWDRVHILYNSSFVPLLMPFDMSKGSRSIWGTSSN